MDSLLDQVVAALVAAGPWIVFVISLIETAAFIGLIVPAEATILAAGFLASRGIFSLESVVVATLGGAVLGDQIGYLLGRHGGIRLARRGGWVGRLWARYEAPTAGLFRRHAALSVTLARFLSFIRTLMPWFAGMSRLPYPRFLFYDLLGIIGWGLGSIAVGYLAGEGWRRVTDQLGTASAVATVLIVAVVVVFLRLRRSRRERGGQRPLRVGLTGNVASGKSTVARMWVRRGAALVDADVLARRAVEPGSPGLEQVVGAFGTDVLDADGGLDRAAMREIVFRDPEARERLEAIVHPEVARLRAEEEAALVAKGARIVVHDIPLLFEVGMEDEFDVVVLVDAPEDVRLERMVRDRGMDPEAARRIIAAQMPSEAKRERADVVIDNTAGLDELEARAVEVWSELERRAGASG